MGALATAIARLFDGQRGALVCWVPVCLGAGIGAYFALPVEPAPWALGAGALILLACAVAGRRVAARMPPAVALWLICAGLALAGARSLWVAEPVLGWRYYGPVEGRVVKVDRSASDAPRLTLDRVVLADTSPERTPRRVRVSLHGPPPRLAARPGQTVILTGHLSPPAGPVEPGGFDFRRMAWFAGIGAVGYTRSPALVYAPPAPRAVPVAQARAAISAAVRAVLPGEVGAFAAAITTGDRSGISTETVEELRLANLAHLLAISGLHMGLLTGVVFYALRLGLVLPPSVALRWPVKKIAAGGALVAAAAYLALSGGNVATQRAFVMAAVVLVAVMLDRRALTLRAVAVAATIVLVLRPEAMTGPGFQLSFAATTALVAVFSALRGLPWDVPRWLRPVLAVVLSSAVAGLATAPFAAAHFNRVPHYGLIANLAAVPLMGSVVMPAAVLAAVLAPFGLGWVGLWIMAPAIRWILFVAEWVAAREGAVSLVVSPGPVVLPVLSLGLLWLVLWQGRARWLGAVPVALAFGLWSQAQRPDLLIASSGRLMGLATERGRVLSKPVGDGFPASVWLENDGDGATQAEAAARPGLSRVAPGITVAQLEGMRVAMISGRGQQENARGACATADLVVLPSEMEDPAEQASCDVLDRAALSAGGAVSLTVTPHGIVRRQAGDTARRPWTGGQ
ncbi:ComEC/Rec2 family competence protein [Tranquillimonas rosea]|uniref:ComEC/Rec2 family competence protein n=1 Tax=Tranquillimonas rosea TaxID=641238 RepID=UPI003BAC87E8